MYIIFFPRPLSLLVPFHARQQARRNSNWLVIWHHLAAIQAGRMFNEFKNFRMRFMLFARQCKAGKALTEEVCKSSRERTRIFFGLCCAKMAILVASQQGHSRLGNVCQLTCRQCFWERSITVHEHGGLDTLSTIAPLLYRGTAKWNTAT